MCFPVNFAKFLRTQFLQNTYGRPRLKTNFLFRISTSDTRIMRKIHLKRALMTRKFVIHTLVPDNDCCLSRNVGRTKINFVTSNKLYFLWLRLWRKYGFTDRHGISVIKAPVILWLTSMWTLIVLRGCRSLIVFGLQLILNF